MQKISEIENSSANRKCKKAALLVCKNYAHGIQKYIQNVVIKIEHSKCGNQNVNIQNMQRSKYQNFPAMKNVPLMCNGIKCQEYDARFMQSLNIDYLH